MILIGVGIGICIGAAAVGAVGIWWASRLWP